MQWRRELRCAEKPVLPFQVTELGASAAVWCRNFPHMGTWPHGRGVVDLLASFRPAFLLVNRSAASGAFSPYGFRYEA